MLRTDYILRLIEQLGAALRTLMGGSSVSEAQTEQSLEMIETACQRVVGLSYSTIRGMAPEQLIELFRSGGGTWLDRSFAVASLLGHDAEISRRAGDAVRARDSAERALYIYSVLKADPGLPPSYEIDAKSRQLIRLLEEL